MGSIWLPVMRVKNKFWFWGKKDQRAKFELEVEDQGFCCCFKQNLYYKFVDLTGRKKDSKCAVKWMQGNKTYTNTNRRLLRIKNARVCEKSRRARFPHWCHVESNSTTQHNLLCSPQSHCLRGTTASILLTFYSVLRAWWFIWWQKSLIRLHHTAKKKKIVGMK